ncbi:hypothetical protein [Marinobacterium aestuariivivens]|uniref:Uncharacterized protein n=1 Tax=Marinobacterium aestuariivivens TaxID=1698799 RepID=A0ABW2A5H2_9GAMM
MNQSYEPPHKKVSGKLLPDHYDGQHICVPSKRTNSVFAYGAFSGIALDTSKNSGLSERNRRRRANDYLAHRHAKKSGADSEYGSRRL